MQTGPASDTVEAAYTYVLGTQNHCYMALQMVNVDACRWFGATSTHWSRCWLLTHHNIATYAQHRGELHY